VSPRRAAGGAAVVAAALVALATLRPRDERAAPARAATAAAPAERPAAHAPPLGHAPSVAHADEPPPRAASTTTPAPRRSDEPVEQTLATALADDDDLAVAAAAELAVKTGATRALPVLLGIELRRAPHAGPAVILAVAALGNEVGPRERADAAATLARWFVEERGRAGADAEGNTSVLVDALAATREPVAIAALVAALDEQTLPLAAETLAVQRLVELRATSARPAVARWGDRVRALGSAEGLEGELRVEALAAAAQALERLGG
jgi:hypothetical protein